MKARSIHRMTITAVTATAASIAYAGSCFWLIERDCCETLKPTALRPELGGPCPDQIQANPRIQIADLAPAYQHGKDKKETVAPLECAWDNYAMNAQGNCVFVGATSEPCTPNTLAGNECSSNPPV